MTDPDLTVGAVLTDDLREWLMAELRYPVLAVISRDGSPSQSVMWFDLDPEQPDMIVMNTMVRAREGPLAAARPARQPLLRGRADVGRVRGTVELDADSERALAGIQALARRYGGDPGRYAGQERVTIRMRVEKVIRHD